MSGSLSGWHRGAGLAAHQTISSRMLTGLFSSGMPPTLNVVEGPHLHAGQHARAALCVAFSPRCALSCYSGVRECAAGATIAESVASGVHPCKHAPQTQRRFRHTERGGCHLLLQLLAHRRAPANGHLIAHLQ